MLGLEPGSDAVALDTVCQLFHPDDRARVWEDVMTLIETGKPLKNEWREQAGASRQAFRPEAVDFSSWDARRRVLCRCFLRLAAAATARGRLSGRLADQFGVPNGCNELLDTVIIEIDGRPLVVGFGDHASPVLFVLDCLSFNQCLHFASS